MKKLLSLLSIFSFSCGSTMQLIGCGNVVNNKPHLAPAKPKKPIIKDVFYYDKLKQEIMAEIKEYDEVIKEIKNIKNDYESKADYQTELKQTQTEQFIKISEINDYEYKILLCQKENDFTYKQKKQAIKLLEKQINNLNSVLNLLSEIKNSDFDQKDLEKIKTNIINLDDLLYKINLNIKDTYDSFWKEIVKEIIIINYNKNIFLEELINKIENQISFKNKDMINNSIIILTISILKEIYTIKKVMGS